MAIYCPRCGHKLPAQARFCPRCGAPLPEAASSATPPTPPALAAPSSRRPPLLLGLVLGLFGLVVAGSLVLHSGRSPGFPPLPPTATTVPAVPTGQAALTTSPTTPLATSPPDAATPTPDAGGNDPAHVVVLEDSLTFADQDPGTTSDPQTVTLSNEGGTAQPLGQPTIDGSNPDGFAVTTDCGDSLDTVSRCTASVTFSPPRAGDYNATLEIVDPQGNTLASVSLSGHGGTGTPDVSVSPSSYNFGSVNIGDSTSSFVTLSNNGSAAVTVQSIDLASDTDVYALSGDCSSSIDAGSSCNEDITFTPQDAVSYDTTLSFTDDQGNVLGSVDIFGMGYDPSASVHMKHRPRLR